MQMLVLALACLLAAGCTVRKTGMAYNDEYDSIQVEQTTGNNVAPRIFQKTIVCLNPRRETRRVYSFTNSVVSVITNVSLVYVTNQTITGITNLSRTFSTNQFAQPTVPPPLAATSTNENAEATATGATADATANVETNTLATVTAAPPPNSTNNTVTTTANVTVSRAPNQTVLTANHQQLLNRQVTLNTTNMNLVSADNEVVSIETNIVVNTYTNLTISTVTNYNVVHTNAFVRDYYLFTEFTPPSDFTLQSSGESLVLLVDGVRHGLTATNTQSTFIARRGFQTTVYRVQPELIADIANAKEVKLRLRGVNSAIEREMEKESRNNFRRFMLKYFSPEVPEDNSQTTVREANLTATHHETN